jgi:tetratricopeptide (TPR) repeat protein
MKRGDHMQNISPQNEAAQNFRNGNFEEAVRLFALALEKDETSELWNDWATAQFQLGRAEEAEEGYRRALELENLSSEAGTNLIVLLISAGHAAEAEPYLPLLSKTVSKEHREGILQAIADAKKPAPQTFDELLNAIYQLPAIPKSVPAYLREALKQVYFDSSAYVAACFEVFRTLPADVQLDAAQKLGDLSHVNYQFPIIGAIYYQEKQNFSDAILLLRKACDRNPADLYAERLLIECELQEAKQAGKPHPTFSDLKEYLSQSFCNRPWEHFEVVPSGGVFTCCSGWMPAPIGNVHTDSPTAIWNSRLAKEIRESILDGSFRFCSKIHCPEISARLLPNSKQPESLVHIQPAPDLHKNSGVALDEHVAATVSNPTTLVFSHDNSCNLACPSCRHDFIMVSKEEQIAIEQMQNRLLAELSQDAQILRLDGAGEVFYSKPSRNMLKKLTRQDYPHLKFDLITNGTLFNRRTYDEFDLSGRIKRLRISIDAASKETYKIARRGGDFDKLLANLEFIYQLRTKENQNFSVNFLFVVSACNFHEMADFIRLGKKFNVTKIRFTAIRNLGHLTDAQFASMNIERESHPDHSKFVELLKAPEFDDPIVDLASVSRFRKPQQLSVGAS